MTKILGIVGNLTGLASRNSVDDVPRPHANFYCSYNLNSKKAE